MPFVGKKLIEASWLLIRFRWQFLVHELLYLYTN